MANYLSRLFEQGLSFVQDNWQNVMTGLGTARDKTVFGSFQNLQPIRDNELTALYHQNDTARKVVALKPQEMMRQGFTVNVEEDVDASGDIVESLLDLDTGAKVRDAMIWGRLYGGAAVIIGADDGLPADEPLDENRIQSVDFLQVIDKRFLLPDVFFGEHEPQLFRVVPRTGSSETAVVHRSRLLLFGGAHTSDEERVKQGGWDHSVITGIYDVLRMFDSVWKSSEHLMSDASQAVFKIQGLMAMIAGQQKEELQTRMQLVDMSRSVARAVLLDADGGEEFKREGSSFTDASVMVEKFMMRLASAADTPVTIFMGRSPAGQNATGDADFRWFYDTIKTAQKNDLLPQLKKLVRILMLSKDGPTGGKEPDKWAIKFAPLWQLTPKEQAELEELTAKKDKLYIDAEVLLPEEVAESRFRPEGFSTETQIDQDVREGMLEAERAPVEPVEGEEKSAEEPVEETGKVVLAPTDVKVITRVNEGRAASGLSPLSIEEGGNLFIAEFDALQKAKGEAVGAAEGDVAAGEIDPGASKDPPPAFGAPPPPVETPPDGEEDPEPGDA